MLQRWSTTDLTGERARLQEPGYSTPGAPSAQAMTPPNEISATLSRPSVMAGRLLRDESRRVARHLTARSNCLRDFLLDVPPKTQLRSEQPTNDAMVLHPNSKPREAFPSPIDWVFVRTLARPRCL